MENNPQPLKVALARDDEPPASSCKTLPSPLPADEEKALAQRLVRPLVERVLREGKDQDRSRLLRDLGEIDPAWTLELLERVAVNDPEEQEFLRSRVAIAVVRESPEDAAALVETFPNPEVRAQAYVELAGAVRTWEPVRARRLVEQAIVNNRAAAIPRRRIRGAIPIIQALIDLHDTERARALIGEVRMLIGSGLEERDRSGELLTLMSPLARLDTAGALGEFGQWKRQAAKDRPGRRESDFDNDTGQMAHALADRSPADAERLLRSVSFRRIRPSNDDVLKVCARMAAKDPARARRLAELIAPGEIEKKPYALGLIAQTVASSDTAAARKLLDEAYDELDGLAARGRVSQFASIAGVAGGLLPIVEQLDPTRLPGFLARALALRPPQTERSEESWIPEHVAPLAMMVARYDRHLAAHILQPSLDDLGKLSLSYGGVDLRTSKILCAEILINPRRAVEMIEALPDSPSTVLNGFAPGKNDLVIDAAKLLSLHGEDRWRHVYEHDLLLWTPDQE